MEIMKMEFGDCFERAWSDRDALLWNGTDKMNRGTASLGHMGITGKNVTLGDCIERLWFDEDDILPVDPWPMMREAA